MFEGKAFNQHNPQAEAPMQSSMKSALSRSRLEGDRYFEKRAARLKLSAN